MGVLLLALFLQDPDPATAARLARSIELFTRYTGACPRTLEDLVRRPDDAPFWPEGGFWRGALPKGATWKDGKVRIGNASIAVSPGDRSAVVPPTDALRQFYAARIRLQLLRAAVEEFRDAKERLPKDASELGDPWIDPWGKPFRIDCRKKCVRLSAADSAARSISPERLTEDELRALEEGAKPRVSEAERKAIRALLDKLFDDDYDVRKEACDELVRLGPMVGPIVAERIATEKDPEVQGRLRRLAAEFPERPPAWKAELAPVSAVVAASRSADPDGDCGKNFSSMWRSIAWGMKGPAFPSETGSAFWLALPGAEPTNLVCPLSDTEPKKGICTYWGPASDVNSTGDGDPIGMCDDEGHGDFVVILRKSGDVDVHPRNGPLHKKALEKLKR
ncbi:MAG: hypothetical protein HYY17_11330 [Planctomycetes bacterium]|nr:hypothetical protein [Planctomycetota bacterium]